MLDVVHDWYLAVSREDEIAVHAVDCEIARDGSLGCCETLCYHGTTVDAAGSWGVPEGSGISEDVLGAEMLV